MRTGTGTRGARTRDIAGRLGRGMVSGLTGEFLGSQAPQPITAATPEAQPTNWTMWIIVAVVVCVICSCCALGVWYFFIRESFQDETEQIQQNGGQQYPKYSRVGPHNGFNYSSQ